ncbi:unnamed protein product, partial [Sphagnum jensenii]
ERGRRGKGDGKNERKKDALTPPPTPHPASRGPAPAAPALPTRAPVLGCEPITHPFCTDGATLDP